MTQSFHCPNCGAPLDHPGGNSATIRCPFCQSSIIVPPELREGSLDEAFLSPGEAFAALPNLAATVQQVAELTRNGQKIEAIKLFREQFGIGLKEAKDAVEQIERGEVVRLTNLSVAAAGADLSADPLPEILALARSGNKIEAIKRYREWTGMGLKESKDAVEALMYSQTTHTSYRVTTQSSTIDPGQAAAAVKTVAVATAGTGCMVLGIIAAVVVITLGVIFFALMAPGGPLEEFGLKTAPFSAQQVTLSFGEEGSGQGLFQDPRSIAVAPGGALIVADYNSGRIQRFDAQGGFERLWLLPDEPIISALDVDRQGIAYAVFGGDIHRFDAVSGDELGLLLKPEGLYYSDVYVAPDDGLVAIANGETLLRFNPDGELDWVVEDAVSTVSGDSELDSRVAADGLGNVYVLGSFNDGIFKFSPEGKYLTRWGSTGDEDGQLRAVDAIAVDGQARVYVSDIRGIHIFESDGRFVRTIRDIGVAFGMDFDETGNLWIVTNTPRVFRYTMKE